MKNSFLIGIIIISFFSCKTPMKNKMPTDPQATHETVALYNRLFNLAEKGMIRCTGMAGMENRIVLMSKA